MMKTKSVVRAREIHRTVLNPERPKPGAIRMEDAIAFAGWMDNRCNAGLVPAI